VASVSFFLTRCHAAAISFVIRTSPSFAAFELSGEDLKACLGAASKAILISSWLASVARRELARFKEFIKWLTFGNAYHLPQFRC
jgi:hypothetical protein